MRRPPPLHVSIAALLLAAACRSQQETNSRDSAAGMMDSGMMKGMPGMRGDSVMGGMMGGMVMQI